MNLATTRRRLQFCAGPQTIEFFACPEHRATLDQGDVSCFRVMRTEPVRDVDPDEDIECDFCREG